MYGSPKNLDKPPTDLLNWLLNNLLRDDWLKQTYSIVSNKQNKTYFIGCQLQYNSFDEDLWHNNQELKNNYLMV